LASIVDFSGTEQDLFQRSSGANSDPCPAREIGMWGCHSPVITAAGCFLGFGTCASHHYAVASAGECLADMPALTHPAIGNDRDTSRSVFEIGVAIVRAIARGANVPHS